MNTKVIPHAQTHAHATATAEPDNRKTKHWLINPRLQIGLVVYSLLLTLTFQITAFIANKMFYENFARTAGTRTPIEEHAALTFLQGQQQIAFNVIPGAPSIADDVAPRSLLRPFVGQGGGSCYHYS
jgi:hypothetical protein